MSPEQLGAYVRVAVRDLMIPLGGLFLAFYLPATHQFALWQLPLLAGMMMVPLVGRSTPPVDPYVHPPQADHESS
jgi:hypothetical protein